MTFKNALAMAATSASTSHRYILTGEELKRILRTGEIPAMFQAHMMTLLQEVPEQLVLSAVNEAATGSVTSDKILAHLSQWAHQWQLTNWTR